MIPVTPHIALDEAEIQERFVRASGPGGQHVNKTSSAVELRFDVWRSPSLSEEVKIRLARLAGSRLTQDGVIVLFAQTHSAQQRNREEALDRLLHLIRQAAIRPKLRRPTKPTLGAKLRRLESKTRRSGVKSARGKPLVGD
jgi:ribosome-associated protein